MLSQLDSQRVGGSWCFVVYVSNAHGSWHMSHCPHNACFLIINLNSVLAVSYTYHAVVIHHSLTSLALLTVGFFSYSYSWFMLTVFPLNECVYCVPSTSTCVCLYVCVVVLVLSIPATSSYDDDVRLMWPVWGTIFWQWNSLCNRKFFNRDNFSYLSNSMEKRFRIALNVRINGHRMTLGYVSLYTLSIR